MTRQFSAGGVVFKRDGEIFLWLIIKPRPSKLFPTERYQLPKGHLEEGETTQTAALREVLEETGIQAKIIDKAGDTKYPLQIGQDRVFKIITYFLMEYVSGGPKVNDEVEQISWLPFEEAKKKLTFSDEKRTFQKASELLDNK